MTKITQAIRVNAAPERVYAALSTADGLKGWNTHDLEGEVSEGSQFTLRYSDGESFSWRVTQLSDATGSWECISGPGAAVASTVTYQLSDTGDGRTSVKVEHDGWPEDDNALATCNTLWGILLGRLKTYAETSHPQDALS